MNAQDVSPKIPVLGSIDNSLLAQRRASKDNLLQSSYYRYEEYDNIPLEWSPKSPTRNGQSSKMSWYGFSISLVNLLE